MGMFWVLDPEQNRRLYQMSSLKSLLKDREAVSPVIGVVLMVAITVILAAAIGSSVLGEDRAEPAPKANLHLKANGINTEKNGTILIEHLGGDPINFEDNKTNTNVTIYNFDTRNTCYPNATQLSTFTVGSIDSFNVSGVSKGNTINIKIIDVASQQLIYDKDLRF